MGLLRDEALERGHKMGRRQEGEKESPFYSKRGSQNSAESILTPTSASSKQGASFSFIHTGGLIYNRLK